MLTIQEINLLKKVIEEEVAIQYGATGNYIETQVGIGFIKSRVELSDYAEELLRIVLTGIPTGKLPSEQLRDRIIISKIEDQQIEEVKRNNAGSILLKIDSNPNLVVSTKTKKIKLNKLRYVFNINFSELLNTTENLEDLIAALRQEIADLRAKLSESEIRNDNLKFSITELETEIQQLQSLIETLESQISDLQGQISQISEEYRKQIDQILADAKAQLDALRLEKDNLEKIKNEQIRDLQGKIDNFIKLENLERDRIIIQDVYRYSIDIDRYNLEILKDQVTYNLSDDLEYGAYIIDSIEPTILSDLTVEAFRESFSENDVTAINTSSGFSIRKMGSDMNVLLNPENQEEPMFASVKVRIREGAFDTGNLRTTHESILMIDLINENALTAEQTNRLLEFSKRKSPLLQ